MYFEEKDVKSEYRVDEREHKAEGTIWEKLEDRNFLPVLFAENIKPERSSRI